MRSDGRSVIISRRMRGRRCTMRNERMTNKSRLPVLRICDSCCDGSGTIKEMVKTGGCTCDVCGWGCKCSGDDCKQFVNRIPVNCIPGEGWEWLQTRNERSNQPLDWQALFET